MTDADFLRAILEAPEDDAPRLAYAGWLQGHGQPERAEYIRIECEQATIHDEPGFGPNRWESPRFWELEARREELYKRHAGRWFRPLRAVFRGEMDTRRGFPWHVALSARQFVERAGAIFEAAPTIEEVFIDRLGGNMPALARCPALGHVRQLEFFETPFRVREAEHLGASPYLGNLRRVKIGFTDTQIGPDGAMALASAETLGRLEQLDLYNHAIYDEGAEAVLSSRRLVTLKDLNLGNNGLGDETAVALAKSDGMRLRKLDLSANHFSDRGVAVLANAPALAGLEKLTLSTNRIGYEAALSLVGARFADRLRELRLIQCRLDDRAVAAVLEAPWPNLEELWLSSNAAGESAAEALSARRPACPLRELSLSRCGIEPAVARRLRQASLPELRDLRLARNPLGPEGVRALLAGPLAGPVQHLDLSETNLGDAGAEAVAQSPVLANVRWLELPANSISDAGAVALAESPHLVNVQSFNLSTNPIGERGREALAGRFGERVRLK